MRNSMIVFEVLR